MPPNDETVISDYSQVRRAGRWVIGFFWALQFIELTMVSLAEGGKKAESLIEPRAVVLAIGVFMTLAVVEVAARSTKLALPSRLARVFFAAFLTCALLVAINYSIFKFGFSIGLGTPFNITDFTYTAFSWSWFFFSVAAALLALAYSFDIRENERQIAELRTIAVDAQLAALRYQLNPHFLFNALNSVAALIGDGQAGPAETMVENLADYLRATLELDPHADITLNEELGLQRLYLAIEQVRFPSRLKIKCCVQPDVERALVPSLLTQPIVENGVRHSVSRSVNTVTLQMSAHRSEDRLLIILEEDGKPIPGTSHAGTGVGVANVRARLQARYGAEQSLISGPLPEGGYRTIITIPLTFAR